MNSSNARLFASVVAASLIFVGACSESKSRDDSNAGSGGTKDTGGTATSNGGENSGGTGKSNGGSLATNGGTKGTGVGTSTIVGTGSSGGTGTGSVAGSSGGQVSVGGTANGGSGQPTVIVPTGLLNPDDTTTWNPGILADTARNQPLGNDGLPVRTTVCRTTTTSDASKLQSILDNCESGTVVELSSGTYTVPATIYIPSGVVLRGQGSTGTNATTIVLSSGASGPVLAIGPKDLFDQACYNNSNYTNAVSSLTADAKKEQNLVSITAKDTTFAAGDFALLDQADDTSLISVGDSNGAFTRKAGRTLSERVEIVAVDTTNGILTLASPLHWTFKKSLQAQITKANYAVSKWVGIEHIWIQGGKGLGEYLGRKAGGIDISNAAYCWVKDVQTDGTLTGMHVALTATHRCVVRDSHFHNSAQYGFGQDNYGIVIRCGATDNLVENNIARYMNKPIVFNNSGGGNVVGYNYADNSWSIDSSSGDQFQESSIDIHSAFPHMELIEGNYAAHISASITHGNAGYLTYFRNYVSSQQAPDPIVWSLPSLPQTGNVAAFQFDKGDSHMTVIGNVLGSTTNASLKVPTSLGTANVSKVYMSYNDISSPSIFSLGPQSDISVTTLRWHGNFDTVNGTTMWNSSISIKTLPASLYYKSKPAWWPAAMSWPWVGPDISPMVSTLQAQVTSSKFNYKTSNNPNCTPNLGNYSCP
jgi:hypothetical protein